MTSDSTIPDLDSNSAIPDAELISTVADDLEVKNSSVSDVESNFAVADADSHPILPDTELNSVIRYLKSNSDPANSDVKSHAANSDVESHAANSDVESNSALADLNALELVLPEQRVNNALQVQLKTEEGRLLLILPTESQVPASEISWSEIWQQMRQRLNAGDRLRTPNTTVHLVAKDRLLDSRQLQQLAEALSEVQLQLKCVATSRRQTAIAAVTSGYSVEQLQPETSLNSDSKTTPTALADALYLEMTVRSGVEIRHPGTVILLGDLNPGGIVVADGDILVWGRLRGIAHAGAGGNRECLIMSLQMEPTQLRIADAVARAPEKSPVQFFPEVAHITPEGIRIARASDFSRSQLSRINQEP
ncbi:septum formation inhibitor [Cylindrospermum stagnale PCC 7417]|uniref:Probable septum site-determining protein MinC n=1 Tax=Cylindrospermum stagnale PCC 7417 TaxID=56107 RepID=K9X4S2_9NOST|nr:septum site-determining protein MinC [Cylindrospermum stagnale]AFZ26652.1 septum formation inhibitor [Cylindrospermum stagnale PCC 7417]